MMRNERAFILAVSTGEGISELFLELGADALIGAADADALCEEDFLAAFRSCGAGSLLILPNSPSARLVAERALGRLSNVEAALLPTRSIAEGYAALAAMPRGARLEQLFASALPAIESTESIEVVCTSHLGAINRRYKALRGGECIADSASAEGALLEAVELAFSRGNHHIITLIVGTAVDNARRVFATERLMELYPDAQIIVYIGAQTATEYYIALRQKGKYNGHLQNSN